MNVLPDRMGQTPCSIEWVCHLTKLNTKLLWYEYNVDVKLFSKSCRSLIAFEKAKKNLKKVSSLMIGTS